MSRARSNGEGSIYQRGDGRWVAQVVTGRLPNGRQRYARATRSSQREALAALRDLQRHREHGVTTDGRQTVGQFLDWWVSNVLPGTVKESTATDYRYVIGRYIAPHVGRVRLSKLSAQHVTTMLRALEDGGWEHRAERNGAAVVTTMKPVSARTRQYARSVLRRALRWAEQNGLVLRNVAALVDGPKLSGTKLDDALDAEGAEAVLTAARTWHPAEDGQPVRPHRLEALAVIALRLGLRKGEALALRWCDIDFDGGTLTVTGTLKRREGGGAFIDTTKTSASARTVPLVGGTVEALREHRRRQAAERLAAPRWHDTGHVFTTPIGTPLDGRNVLRWWHELCEKAGVGRRRFHASRHTAATLLLDQGVPLEVVSAVLGHAGLAITADTYVRVTQDSMRRALATLETSTA